MTSKKTTPQENNAMNILIDKDTALTDLLKAIAEIEMEFGVADLHIGFIKLNSIKVKNIIEIARDLRDAVATQSEE